MRKGMPGMWMVWVLGCGGLWGGGSELERGLRAAGMHPDHAPLTMEQVFVCQPAASASSCVAMVTQRVEGMADSMGISIEVTALASGTVALRVPTLDARVQRSLLDVVTESGRLCIQGLASAEALQAFVAQAGQGRLVVDVSERSFGESGLSAEERSQLQTLAEGQGYTLGRQDDQTYLLLDAACALDATHVKDASVGISEGDGQPYILVSLTAEGAERLATFTAAQVKQPVAMRLGEKVLMVPIVQETITGGSLQITQGMGGGDVLENMLESHARMYQVRYPYPLGTAVEQTETRVVEE